MENYTESFDEQVEQNKSLHHHKLTKENNGKLH